MRIGQTPKREHGFPEGAIPCRRLSLLVFVSLIWNQPRTIQPGWRWSNLRPDLRSASAERGPDLTATSDPVALRGLDPKGSSSRAAEHEARHRTASRGRKAIQFRVRGEPRRASARRPSTGTLAVVRGAGRVTGPRSPGHEVTRAVSSSDATKSTASGVTPRGFRGLGLPCPSARTDAVLGPQWPPSPPVGADARMVRAPDRDRSQAGFETTRGYPTPKGVRISGKIKALEGATPRAPPARNKAGRDQGGV